MIHPHTTIKLISAEMGYGVFATEFIPKGAITFVKDPLDIIAKPDEYLAFESVYREIFDKYSYIEGNGDRVLSWDIAKYVNHSCSPNSISTGYGFEIAISDIQPGEEITDEYGIFNVEAEMVCCCGSKECRGVITRKDFERLSEQWDIVIKDALPYFLEVSQPLLKYIDSQTHADLMRYLNTKNDYRAILTQHYVGEIKATNKSLKTRKP